MSPLEYGWTPEDAESLWREVHRMKPGERVDIQWEPWRAGVARSRADDTPGREADSEGRMRDSKVEMVTRARQANDRILERSRIRKRLRRKDMRERARPLSTK